MEKLLLSADKRYVPSRRSAMMMSEDAKFALGY
jgi:hypothetical protein